MAKKKHNTNNTPRRKRYNRRDRLQNAKKWAEQNNGNNLAKRYSKWFGVDLNCAITHYSGFNVPETIRFTRQQKKDQQKCFSSKSNTYS